ncbi:GNAT family N-acetyltransferase [Phocea massiliensis]|uniref:GNAT family N-acetyltransferase n=1 Tax=Merdimmobilis hominis TaxID=2897707 RepID=A0A938X9T3_9FIRM|nr:GNAT family N-acetyltransferase [Merdimmobilis hominis]MBM6921750.1 GNAT family N-acetyltransferase [Merdimmobilis hominis]
MEFIWKQPNEDLSACFSCRKTVFCEEQGFSADGEFDKIDAQAVHVLCLHDGVPCGTARLFWDNKPTIHAGRICLLKEMRGDGNGLKLLDELAKKAKELGASRMILGAQCRAMGFYEKAGYRPFGEVFDDEGCPHQMMEKLL